MLSFHRIEYWQHHPRSASSPAEPNRAHGTTDDVCAFLRARSHPTLGLETLAILYSLPYALLLWGMVSFLAAFAWNCFAISNIATRVIMATAWVAFAVLVMWCMWMGWVPFEHSDGRPISLMIGWNEAPAAADDTQSGTGATSPAEKHGSVRPGAESRLSRVSSRPSRAPSRLGAHPHTGPVQTRPGSRLSQMSRVSGAPVHVPMTPVREATMEVKIDEVQVAPGVGDPPPSTGVVGAIRSLWRWPARLIFPGARRRSYDSQRTVTVVRPSSEDV
ncbi:hypothetical protein NMY22_g16257 [Coprinellus aureogranulatus]|nr:hypothetical protein NMY22_g16257 [Coprinellus aureogranulatus]